MSSNGSLHGVFSPLRSYVRSLVLGDESVEGQEEQSDKYIKPNYCDQMFLQKCGNAVSTTQDMFQMLNVLLLQIKQSCPHYLFLV